MRFLNLLSPIVVVLFLAFVASANDSQSVLIDGWGTVYDPDGDCRIFIEDDKVTITVPDTPHDMNPDRGPVNAPRILRKITGDFTVKVRVTGDFSPGKETTNPRSAPFNGAGLLLWIGEGDYIRLERNVWMRGEDQRQCFPPLFQAFKDGVDQGTNPPLTTKEFFVGKSTWLEFERHGAVLTASCSHDGEEWVFAKRIELELPETVCVGVSASNTSNRPFRVTFDQYELKTKKRSSYRRSSR